MIKIIILVFLFAGNLWSLTLKKTIAQIRYRIGDTLDKKFYLDYTDSELTDIINILQRIIVARTDCMRRRYFIDTDTDTASYVLPSTVIKVYRVYYEDSNSTGSYKKLDYLNTNRLDIDFANWENTDGGTPLEWYQLFISTWNTSEIRIGLYPPPAGVDAGTDKLRVDFSEQAQDLSSDSDIPFNNNPRLYPYHAAIIWGVVAMIAPNEVTIGNYISLLEMLRSNLLEVPGREKGITPRRR